MKARTITTKVTASTATVTVFIDGKPVTSYARFNTGVSAVIAAAEILGMEPPKGSAAKYRAAAVLKALLGGHE